MKRDLACVKRDLVCVQRDLRPEPQVLSAFMQASMMAPVTGPDIYNVF